MTAPTDRASFTLKEIAERNAVSVPTVYRHVKYGTLKVTKLGTGKRPTMRVTIAQEAQWLESLAGGQDAS
jgi:excisionase family DNA binding protein